MTFDKGGSIYKNSKTVYIANVRRGKFKTILISGHENEFISYHLKK